jgi:hypothetical protein
MAARFSEMSAYFYQTTRYRIPKNVSLFVIFVVFVTTVTLFHLGWSLMVEL